MKENCLKSCCFLNENESNTLVWFTSLPLKKLGVWGSPFQSFLTSSGPTLVISFLSLQCVCVFCFFGRGHCGRFNLQSIQIHEKTG